MTHFQNGAFQGQWNPLMKQVMQMNITWLKIQLAGGRPVGYLQAGPRSWTGVYAQTTLAKWSEWDLNLQRLDLKSGAQTTRPMILNKK